MGKMKGRRFRLQLIRLLLIAFTAAAGLLSCGRKTVLIAADTFWHESGYFTGEKLQEIKQAARKEGAGIEIVKLPRSDGWLAALKNITAEKKPDIILLSPMLTASAVEIPKDEFQTVKVVGLSLFPDTYGADIPFGLITVSRERAFRELGVELCSSVRKADIKKTGVPAIIGFWFTGNDTRKREYEHFFDGFSAGCSPELCDITELNTVSGNAAVNVLSGFETVEGMVGLAFAGEQNDAYLKQFMEKGLGIASEYLFLENFPETVPFFTIALPMKEIIRNAAGETPAAGERRELGAVLLKRE